MKYVACKFRPEDTRQYTYAYDGPDDLVCGDEVKVPDPRSDDGWKRVYVVDITDEAPSFACKKILGKVEPEADAATAASEAKFCADCGQPDADCDCLPF